MLALAQTTHPYPNINNYTLGLSSGLYKVKKHMSKRGSIVAHNKICLQHIITLVAMET